MAAMANTTMISSSVNPRSRFMAISVRDVPVLALAAVLAIGAERHEVVGLALAGQREAIVVAPRVLEVGLLRVRAVPLVHAAGLAHERLQVVGVLPDLELVHLDLPHELLDADLRLLALGAAHLLEDLGA